MILLIYIYIFFVVGELIQLKNTHNFVNFEVILDFPSSKEIQTDFKKLF